jgi:hypothetical protein
MISSKYMLFIILLAAFSPANSEIYKWVGDDGETHYGERKPAADLDVETIKPVDLKTTGQMETWQEREAAFSERREEADKQAKKLEEDNAHTDKVEHACKQATIRAASLEPARINKVDANGQRIRTTEEWRQTQLSEARAAVEKYCS